MDSINFYDPKIIVGAILIFILFIIYEKFIKTNKNTNILNTNNSWTCTGYGYGHGSSNPSAGLQDLIKIFGQPSVIDTRAGGFARWNKDKLGKTPGENKSIFEKIEIRDQEIPHDKPQPHSDFLYTWYKIDIPENKLNYLHHISDTIQYDPKQKMLLVRCCDIRANVIITWITRKFVDDQIKVDEANAIMGPMYEELLQDYNKYHELEQELL